jgi:asparagine synthase (glutamine-hydrolysing)
MRHRGPDGSSTVVIEKDGKCNALAHERLILKDNSDEGKQPMTNPDHPNLVSVHNGEIYNYPELRKKYEGKYKFHGICDS